MYQLAVKTGLDKKFKKLRKKDKELLGLIERKVQEILSDPFRFKPLKKPLQNKRGSILADPLFLSTKSMKTPAS
jgi:mRNA interferase RelE/StbE